MSIAVSGAATIVAAVRFGVPHCRASRCSRSTVVCCRTGAAASGSTAHDETPNYHPFPARPRDMDARRRDGGKHRLASWRSWTAPPRPIDVVVYDPSAFERQRCRSSTGPYSLVVDAPIPHRIGTPGRGEILSATSSRTSSTGLARRATPPAQLWSSLPENLGPIRSKNHRCGCMRIRHAHRSRVTAGAPEQRVAPALSCVGHRSDGCPVLQ